MKNNTKVAAAVSVAAAFSLLGGGLTGCSVKVETNSTPSVGAADLQKDLNERLSAAGMTVKSVTCKDDLVGEVGKTAGCAVEFSENNTVEAVFTATKVDGSTVNFDILPALTKDQLQKAATMIAAAQSATCDSGVDGKVGARAKCEVTKDGATTKQVAEVTEVDPAKLGLEVSLWEVLSNQQVKDLLSDKMAADLGQAPETIDCVDDVIKKQGSVVECSVSSGGQTTAYDVLVTDAQGDMINLDYKAKS